MVQHIDIVERYGYNLYVDVYDLDEGQADGDNWVFGIEYLGKKDANGCYVGVLGAPELHIDQETHDITADIDFSMYGASGKDLHDISEAIGQAYLACLTFPIYIHEWISLQK